MNHSLVIAMAVLAILLIVLVPMAYYRPAWPPAVAESFSTETDAYQAGARATYIDQGKALYNKFSDTNDIQRGNFLHVDDPAELKAGNRALQDVMGTSGLEPSETSATYLGILRDVVSSQLSPNSGLLKETKKCEALKGRGACATLGTPGYENCGVCIKGGTTHDGRNEGKHIGGLLIIPEDKADATANRTPFQPTVGTCPEGYYFLDAATCKKEAHRADCTEIGESGGFNGGKTAEGVAWSPSIGCAQVPVSGNSFV